MTGQNLTAVHDHLKAFAFAVVVAAAMMGGALPASAQEVIEGKAILAHPAGRAILEAGKLLKAGKLDEVKRSAPKDVREEWAAAPASDRKEAIEEATKTAPDPKRLESEIARGGVLTNYGDSAMLRVEAADGNSMIMAFVALDAGTWLVTAGPKTVDTTPVVESAPAIEGPAILDHEIGKVALAYAKAIASGKSGAVTEWMSAPARAKLAAAPADERREIEAYRKSTIPAPAVFAEQIRSGGRISFVDDKAYLQTVVSETTKNADGSITASSSSMSLGFELDHGKWRVTE
jgi:hypothetical protein